MMRTRDCPVVETPDFLLAALEQANDAVVIVDSDLHVSYFNAAAELIWRLDRTEVLGRHVSCLGLEELRQQSAATPASDQIGGDDAIQDRCSEIRIERRDGSRIRAALTLSHVEAGGQGRTIAFVRDITREVERRERMALLTLVADRTNRAVIVTDRDLKIIYTNAAFAGLFGYSIGEVSGRQAIDLLAGRHTDRRTLARLRHWIGEESGGEEEILAYDKNGDEIWISANVKAFRDGRGRIKYTFALLTDISETKQLRSLQQLILSALADELPITEIADRLCRRVEEIAPDVVSSLLHIDAGGLIHPLGGPSLPEDYSRALDGVAIGPDVGSCGSAAFYGKPALAMDIDTDPRWQPYKPGARSRPARLLVHANQVEGWPRDRNLRLLFQGISPAEPLARAHRRCLRASRRAGDRALGSPRPDRAARLLRYADRPAEPYAPARFDLGSDRAAPGNTLRWRSWMSIISRTSTIRSDTLPATNCSSSSPNACVRRFSRTTCWGAWAATNS
jgi:PAS domain S-box-containing protein